MIRSTSATHTRTYKVPTLLAILMLLVPLLAACGATGGGNPQPSTQGQATAPQTSAGGQPTSQATQATTGPADTTAPGGATATQPTGDGAATEPQPTQQQVAGGNPTGGEFHGAYPYQMPPTGHYNTFAVNSILGGTIYHDLLEMPFGIYQWAKNEYYPLMATKWEVVPPNKFRVNLREGAKWSDGSTFSSKDVVTTFNLLRLQNAVAWNYLGSVEADGDNAVTFTMKEPSTVVPRYILRERIRANSVYGEWARKAEALFAKNVASDSKEVDQLRTQFEEFPPKGMVVSGPYRIDPASITEAQLTLTKVPTAWDANQVHFDRVVLFNGETPAITPIALSKQLDYATHGFPPATEKAFQQQGIRILRPPTYSGPSLFFNYAKIKAVADPKVRQAIAMAINKEENGTVSLGESARPTKYMSGVADSLIENWVDKGDLDKLKSYEYNLAEATRMMEQLGFKKQGQIWVSPAGEKMQYELGVPAEFADWSAAAQNLATQLTRFGVKTTVRPVTFTQWFTDVANGRFQLGIVAWGAGNPHPHFSYVADLLTYNAPQAAGPGMSYKLQQTTQSVGQVDLRKLTLQTASGLDEQKQRAAITKLATAFNELLPIIPLWERLGNNPALEGERVVGWPPENDPIYQNSPYSDSFTVLMILNGTLKGKTQ